MVDGSSSEYVQVSSIETSGRDLDSLYGQQLFGFVHGWDFVKDDPSTHTEEAFHLRKKTLDNRKSELSIVDKDGERIGLIEGYWYQDGQGNNYFDTFESHNPLSRLRGHKVREYNQKPPRTVPHLIADTIVNVVSREQVTWYSANAMSTPGRNMYEYIGKTFSNVVNVDTTDMTPAQNYTNYKVTPRVTLVANNLP